MDGILQAVSMVGFPIVMCGVLCYYIYKVQTQLIQAINDNTQAILQLTKGGVDDGK